MAPGDYFGAAELMKKEFRRSTVQVMSPKLVLLALLKDEFEVFLEMVPGVHERLAGELV